MRKNKIISIVFTLLITTSIFIFTFKKVEAIPLSPDKYFLQVETGKTVEEVLKIPVRTEDQGEKGGQKYYVQAVGMKQMDEFHSRNFYFQNEDDMAEPANWINLEITEFTTEPGVTVEIPWTMTPTDMAGCGTNLAAIMVSDRPLEENTEDGSVVKIGTQIVSQIHLDILSTPEGECNNIIDLGLEEFVIKRDEQNGLNEEKTKGFRFLDKIFFNYDQVPFITRIKNNGNLIARSPMGYIDIAKDLDNVEAKDKITLAVNKEEGGFDIYPGTIRRLDNEWIDEEYPHDGGFFEKLGYEIKNFKFGKYEARLGLTKNVNPPIVAKEYFYIFPWRVILMIVLFILLILIGFYIFYRKGKSDRKK